MGGPHGIRAPRAEVPLHRAKPQVCVGLVSGPSRWVHLGAAPGKGLARRTSPTKVKIHIHMGSEPRPRPHQNLL